MGVLPVSVRWACLDASKTGQLKWCPVATCSQKTAARSDSALNPAPQTPKPLTCNFLRPIIQIDISNDFLGIYDKK